MRTLKDRKVLVTGGSSGIGAATVRALRESGCEVAALGRSRDRLAEVCNASGAGPAAADLADEPAVQVAVTAAAERLGGLDAVVNNAGLMLHSRPSAGVSSDWRQMVDVNVLALLRVTHAALPNLEAADQGDVVNVGDRGGSDERRGLHALLRHQGGGRAADGGLAPRPRREGSA
ncbi:MAG: SDR family NAD(P)-dependent oxidoreductase [Propionibacteriales bacterium]|nr:SDR family NAD(P)-dependent oxidoreductase [Propionibacteriales bacterium]